MATETCSAKIYRIAAELGWDAKWDATAEQEAKARAVKLLAEAAEILERIERAGR